MVCTINFKLYSTSTFEEDDRRTEPAYSAKIDTICCHLKELISFFNRRGWFLHCVPARLHGLLAAKALLFS